MNKKAVSISNRQDGVPTQDHPFHENPDFKWHDFYNMDMPPPGYLVTKIQAPIKLKVNLEVPDQLYYYLGEPSTEAKCYYTDKPGGSDIVAKANFMERVQPRAIHQYQAPRQPLAAARSAPTSALKQIAPSITSAARMPNEKPYIYKPRDPAQPHTVMWGIDHQSLANQRNFLADSSGSQRSSQQFGLPGQQNPQSNYQDGEPTHNGVPLHPFPGEHYYSMTTLPAAYPGQHSGFTQAARRLSQGTQNTSRPSSGYGNYVPSYQSLKQQQAQQKQSQPGAPPVPMMASSMGGSAPSASASSLPPIPYNPNGSRPSSSSHSHHSPYGAPLTPATTHSATSASKSAEAPPSDSEYINDLQKYPYLLKSYCRKPKVYESPYPLGGGFSNAYQPMNLLKQEGERKRSSTHTPSASTTSLADSGRRASQPWTPPSQVWVQAGLSKCETPPPQAHMPQNMPQQAPPRQYPQPTYSTPQEFQRQIQSLPSTASRDGAQARRLRDQGYVPQQSPIYHRNSFGQSYETARMPSWNSPKAPTPSPLSDPNTPGQTPTSGRPWGSLSRAEVAPMMGRPNPLANPNPQRASPYGPIFPPMQGGHETWRYN